MKLFTQIRTLFLGILVCFSFQYLQAQSILDPNDPIRDPSPSIQQPEYGKIGKWVRRKKMDWNTDSYKAYIYKGRQFRLKFPRTYIPDANDGKKYPVYVFFHGLGEIGDIYDNEYQLYRGGLTMRNAVDSGRFDGYLLYMQSEGFFGPTEYQLIAEILDYMVANNKLDPFRIYLNGLSAGSQAVWEMMTEYPMYATCGTPISNVSPKYGKRSYVDSTKFTPIWLFQGGLDLEPSPYTAHQVLDSFQLAGANFRYTEFPTLNHVCWDSAWAEPDYFPFLLRSYASNPWSLYNKTEYHAGDAPIIIGVPPGYEGYEWRRNGVLIPHENRNTLNVTAGGIYDAHVKKKGIWSEWSRIPVKIKGPDPVSTVNASISPNPFRQSFTIHIKADHNGLGIFSLFDADGRLVDQFRQSLVAGMNTVTWRSNKLVEKGIYLLKITQDQRNTVYKVLKQ
jgi:large repetitive protein